METTVFHNANVLDCTGRDPYLGTVVVTGDRIQAAGPADQVSTPRDAKSFDLSGMTLMPGLIDAHAHVALMGGHMGGFEADYPGAIFPLEVAKNIEDYLMHGFTTIRDAGGCDWSFKLAVQRGLIRGPRMFVSNSFISQTGGHGDLRQRHDHSPPAHEHPLLAAAVIADRRQ